MKVSCLDFSSLPWFWKDFLNNSRKWGTKWAKHEHHLIFMLNFKTQELCNGTTLKLIYNLVVRFLHYLPLLLTFHGPTTIGIMLRWAYGKGESEFTGKEKDKERFSPSGIIPITIERLCTLLRYPIFILCGCGTQRKLQCREMVMGQQKGGEEAANAHCAYVSTNRKGIVCRCPLCICKYKQEGNSLPMPTVHM